MNSKIPVDTFPSSSAFSLFGVTRGNGKRKGQFAFGFVVLFVLEFVQFFVADPDPNDNERVENALEPLLILVPL